MSFTFGILTISDTCSNKQNTDHSGPALQALVKQHYPEAEILFTKCIPDDYETIKQTLRNWCDVGECNVILTTGGTGFAPRDVTPEATRAILDKLAPAVSQHINHMSMQITPMALLSRAICGVRGRTLVLNLPGSKKAAVECFGFVAKPLKHAVDLLLDRKAEVVKMHMSVQGDHSASAVSKVRVGCAALRNRKSPFPMVPVDLATKLILDHVDLYRKELKGNTELIRIENSLGRVLAEDVMSTTPLPPFPASTKDGYAVIASDGAGVRKVVEAIAAGDSPVKFTLQPGQITRISTGAAVPNGADAVVQVEDTELVTASDDNMLELEVKINTNPSVGLDIRPIGSDIPENAKILNERESITAAHIGIMAAIGITHISVYTRFTIGIISSGNELQKHGQTLEPGRIFDSNKLTLINLLKQYNYEGTDCGIARDDPNEIKGKIALAFDKHDVLITTGGVSMGEYDLIKQVLLQDFEAQIHFGRVDMKPGKPTTFATCVFNGRRKLVFALPGNPVSASVTFILFVLPALQRMEMMRLEKTHLSVFLDMEIKLDPRPEYMRATLIQSPDGKFLAEPAGNQISSRLNSLVGADVLLILPARTAECDRLLRGSKVEAIKLGGLW